MTPKDFDFDRLARSGRDGKTALAALVRNPDPEIARHARIAAVLSSDLNGAVATEDTVAVHLRALPPGTALPRVWSRRWGYAAGLCGRALPGPRLSGSR